MGKAEKQLKPIKKPKTTYAILTTKNSYEKQKLTANEITTSKVGLKSGNSQNIQNPTLKQDIISQESPDKSSGFDR